jgi:hypothetical protein
MDDDVALAARAQQDRPQQPVLANAVSKRFDLVR